MQDFLEQNKPYTQLEVNCIEKAVFEDLKKVNFTSEPTLSPGSASGDFVDKLQGDLTVQTKGNNTKMQLLVVLAQSEMDKQKMHQVLQSLQLEIIEAYKNMLLSKQESGKFANSERDNFERLLEKKTRILSYMKSLYF